MIHLALTKNDMPDKIIITFIVCVFDVYKKSYEGYKVPGVPIFWRNLSFQMSCDNGFSENSIISLRIITPETQI